jgi:hypothetical protein
MFFLTINLNKQMSDMDGTVLNKSYAYVLYLTSTGHDRTISYKDDDILYSLVYINININIII